MENHIQIKKNCCENLNVSSNRQNKIIRSPHHDKENILFALLELEHLVDV